MVSLVPVAPIGWPSAIAPPLTFTLSRSKPSSRITARLCDANASFNSINSMSSSVRPASARALGTATVGPTPITSGAPALHDHDRRGAVAALRRVPGGDGAALLERRLELGERRRRRVPPRPLVAGEGDVAVAQLATVVHPLEADLERDDLRVEAARVHRLGGALVRAQREGVLLLAADAVALGHHLAGQAHGHVVLGVAADQVGVGREVGRRGRSERHRLGAAGIAWRPDEQKRFTVWPGTLSGRPARSAARRATFSPCAPSGTAQPRMTSSTSAGSSPSVRLTASAIAAAAMSSGLVARSVPFGALPTAVRAPATMTAWFIIDPLSSGL